MKECYQNNERLFWLVFHNVYLRRLIFYHIKTMSLTFRNEGNQYLGNRISFKFMNKLGKLTKKNQWSLLKLKLENEEIIIITNDGINKFLINCKDIKLFELLFKKKSNEISKLVKLESAINWLGETIKNSSFTNCTALEYYLSTNSTTSLISEHWLNLENICYFFIKNSTTDHHIQRLDHYIQSYNKSNNYLFKEEIYLKACLFSNNLSLHYLINNNINPPTLITTFEKIFSYLINNNKNNNKINNNISQIKTLFNNNINILVNKNNGSNSNGETQCFIKILKMCIINGNFEVAKMVVDQLRILPNFNDLIDAIDNNQIEIMKLFLLPSNNRKLLNKPLYKYSNLFNKNINQIKILSSKQLITKLLFDSKIYEKKQEKDQEHNIRVLFKFDVFKEIIDEELQLELVNNNMVEIITKSKMETYINEHILSSIYRDPLYSQAFRMYLKKYYKFIDHSKFTNTPSSITSLYLIEMLENEDFKTIQDCISSTPFIKQMVELILNLYSIRPKIKENIIKLLTENYNQFKWFIDIDNGNFTIPKLLLFNNYVEIDTNPTVAIMPFCGFSISNKLDFISLLIQKRNSDSTSNITLDQTIKLFYPFYGFKDFKEVRQLLKSLTGLISCYSITLILNSYLYEIGIPNCETNVLKEMTRLNFFYTYNIKPVSSNLKDIYGKQVDESLLNKYDKPTLAENRRIQSQQPDENFKSFIDKLISIFRIYSISSKAYAFSILHSFCFNKSRFKEIILDDRIGFDVSSYISSINEDSHQKVVKIILKNYKDFSNILKGINLIQTLENLIKLKYPIKTIRLLIQVITSGVSNSDNTGEISLLKIEKLQISTSVQIKSYNAVALVLTNKSNEYYKELLRLLLMNHSLFNWNESMATPLLYSMFFNNTAQINNDELISQLFINYNNNNNYIFTCGTKSNTHKRIQNSPFKSNNSNIGPSFSELFSTKISNAGSIGLTTSIWNGLFSTTGSELVHGGLLGTQTKTNNVTPPAIVKPPIDIHKLIKKGKVYEACSELSSNNYLAFELQRKECWKLINYYDINIIEQLFQFFPLKIINDIQSKLQIIKQRRLDFYQFFIIKT